MFSGAKLNLIISQSEIYQLFCIANCPPMQTCLIKSGETI